MNLRTGTHSSLTAAHCRWRSLGPMEIVLGVLGSLIITWLALAFTLLLVRPRGKTLGEFLRLMPETLRLFRGLVRDPEVAAGVKFRVWLLFAYLAMPIDLVPDFIPVLGYADDAIIAAIVLRSVIRRAGPAKVREHWSGSEGGLQALLRVTKTR